ncbi:MAG: hypothetical protein JWO25_2783 [Alphaproteobacteria bacterium]|nr:hypothetical protein [Alphaproteobacteria bacterium]
MSTPSAPGPEAAGPPPEPRDLAPYRRRVVRVVEGQHLISTNRLAASPEAQALLEALVEEVKPPWPEAARGLHFLLATPFRYGHRFGSRFRSAGQRPGIFYASEGIAAAIAETAYLRMRFFSRSPGAVLPATTTEYTSFSVPVRAERALDLTLPPFAGRTALWTSDDYRPCRQLAAAARAISAQAIRYRSARDPAGGINLALLDPSGFTAAAPRIEQSWHFRFVGASLAILASFPARDRFGFDFADFGLRPPETV